MIRDENTLKELIIDFLTKVDSGTRLLEEYFGVRDIRRFWHTKAIKRCGKVTGGVKYELHGIGCFIHLPKETVNFDYGPNGEINGFDIWRLYNFACDRPSKHKKYCDEEIVEKEFKEYINLNKIKKMSAISNLYVLTDLRDID
ncbi:DUF6896 domain-containing protein [Pseudomonas gozinkensis]|uniref:DUF6896 domain-containing protein n=1 Tax=Pseudomonas gozinkensis TaxID=2774461 RepID=UPI0017889D64|nr:hypothetical protein [Pseudomonas gozinkensis]